MVICMRVSCAKCHSQASITSPEQVAGTEPHFPNSILFLIEFLQPFRSPSNSAAAFGGRRSYIWTALRCLSNLASRGNNPVTQTKQKKTKKNNKKQTHANTRTKTVCFCQARIAALQPPGCKQHSLLIHDELFSLFLSYHQVKYTVIRGDAHTSVVTWDWSVLLARQTLVITQGSINTASILRKQAGTMQLAVQLRVPGLLSTPLEDNVALMLTPCCPFWMSGFGRWAVKWPNLHLCKSLWPDLLVFLPSNRPVMAFI